VILSRGADRRSVAGAALARLPGLAGWATLQAGHRGDPLTVVPEALSNSTP